MMYGPRSSRNPGVRTGGLLQSDLWAVESAVSTVLGRFLTALARRSEQFSLWALMLSLVALPSWLGSSMSTPLQGPGSPGWPDFHLYLSWAFPFVAPGLWLLSRCGRSNRRPFRWGPPFLTLPLAGLIALSIVQAPFALDARSTVQLIAYQVALFGFYLMAVNGHVPRAAIAGSLAAGMAIQSAIALPQALLGHSLRLEALGETTVDALRTGASVVVVGHQRWLRAYGLAAHPNLLGGYLMVGMLVVAGYTLGRRGRVQIPLFLAEGLGLAALLVTFSRSAWIGVALGCLVVVALTRGALNVKWRSLKGLAAVAMALGLLFFAAGWQLLVPRLSGAGDETEVRSIEERQLLNEAALSLIQRRPIPGVGLANFSTAVLELVPESPLGPPVQPVHNVPLLAAAELGIPGGMLWLFTMVGPWIALCMARKRICITPWLAGLSGALGALSVVAMLDYYYWIIYPGSMMQWLLWGLWAREWQTATEAAPRIAPETSPRTSKG